MRPIAGFTTLLFIISFFSFLPAQVSTGLDNIERYEDTFRGKRLGLITNHTAYDSRGNHLIDVISELPDVQITALFGPEHGIRGKEDAGKAIRSDTDSTLQIPIYSLYGKTRKPTEEMLQNVDMLVFDIQDIGARFYTYIWTMALAMEAAAQYDKEFVVLDRPNPINGKVVEGNLLHRRFKSFVGMFPIPVRHGMTAGELARMFNEERWLKAEQKTKLIIIPMKYWLREMWYDQTGLRFIKPSPNMPDLQTATVYPGICLLEGTNISEGRGTYTPFMHFGAPWIDADSLSFWLNGLNLTGVRFIPTSFTPVSIPGMSTHPKYENQLCFGARIEITDRDRFKPYWTGLRIVEIIFRHYKSYFEWRQQHFDRLCGTDKIRQTIVRGKDLKKLREQWQTEPDNFLSLRRQYLLY